jgi:thiol-disulfide isomerase/thioredoxin
MNRVLQASVLLAWLPYALSSSPVIAQQDPEHADIPHVSKRARENFSSAYLFAEEYKAFAIAPGGAWSWSADEPSREKAVESALSRCRKFTQQKCVLFAVNDEVVFDHEAWPSLWGPYKSAQQASQAPIGSRVGERFFDLLLNKEGKQVKLSDMREKVVLLHLWGSWCPTCCRELPSLQTLYDSLVEQKMEVEVVLAQVREPFSTSQNWLKSKNFSLPSYDSGSIGEADEQLSLADGGQIEDRQLAKVFPATFVLDKHGIVVFSRMGPISDWPKYLPFLMDAVERSGK